MRLDYFFFMNFFHFLIAATASELSLIFHFPERHDVRNKVFDFRQSHETTGHVVVSTVDGEKFTGYRKTVRERCVPEEMATVVRRDGSKAIDTGFGYGF